MGQINLLKIQMHSHGQASKLSKTLKQAKSNLKDKALHYAEHLGNNIECHNSFMKVIERKDVEAANNYLRAMIISAACTSGMGKFSPCVFYRKNQRVAAGARKARWFDDVCRRKRRDFLRSLRDGREELQDTKKECRKHTRRAMKLCFRIQAR